MVSPNHSTRIVETENAWFIENGEVSGSEEPRNVEIREVRVQIPLPCTYSKIVVPEVVPPSNQQEQHNNIAILHNENIINESAVDVPQEVALRKSQRQRRNAISDDFWYIYMSRKLIQKLTWMI